MRESVRTCRSPGEILAGKAVSFSSFAGHEFYFAEPGTTTKKSEARKLGKPYREALAKFLIVKGQTQYEYKPELKPPPLASVPKDPLKCATRLPMCSNRRGPPRGPHAHTVRWEHCVPTLRRCERSRAQAVREQCACVATLLHAAVRTLCDRGRAWAGTTARARRSLQSRRGWATTPSPSWTCAAHPTAHSPLRLLLIGLSRRPLPSALWATTAAARGGFSHFDLFGVWACVRACVRSCGAWQCQCQRMAFQRIGRDAQRLDDAAA